MWLHPIVSQAEGALGIAKERSGFPHWKIILNTIHQNTDLPLFFLLCNEGPLYLVCLVSASDVLLTCPGEQSNTSPTHLSRLFSPLTCARPTSLQCPYRYFHSDPWFVVSPTDGCGDPLTVLTAFHL